VELLTDCKLDSTWGPGQWKESLDGDPETRDWIFPSKIVLLFDNMWRTCYIVGFMPNARVINVTTIGEDGTTMGDLIRATITLKPHQSVSVRSDGPSVLSSPQIEFVDHQIEVPQIEPVCHSTHVPLRKHPHGPMVTVTQMIAHAPCPRVRTDEVVYQCRHRIPRLESG
jgi:hypothetical protein